jgi:hypothetical protein
VSTRPFDARGSGTRRHTLIEDTVYISAKAPTDYGRGAGERGVCQLGRYECPSTDRHEFADGPAVPGDHEHGASIDGTHDPAAVISEFTLGDLTSHRDQRSTYATGATRSSDISGQATPSHRRRG